MKTRIDLKNFFVDSVVCSMRCRLLPLSRKTRSRLELHLNLCVLCALKNRLGEPGFCDTVVRYATAVAVPFAGVVSSTRLRVAE